MKRAALVLGLLGTTVAHAGGLHVRNVTIVDPDRVVDRAAIEEALAAAPVATALARCTTADADFLVWIVFDNGKVGAADAAGSDDRKVEACATKALRAAKLASKRRIGVAVELVKSQLDDLPTIGATTTQTGAGGVGHHGAHDGDALLPGRGPSPLGDSRVMADHPPDAVHRVMRAHEKTFRACFEKRLVDDPKLAGKVIVRFQIKPSGKVGDASIVRGFDAKLETCLLGMVRAIEFPATKEPTAVEFPFIFAAGN